MLPDHFCRVHFPRRARCRDRNDGRGEHAPSQSLAPRPTPADCEFRTLWGSPTAKIVGTHADSNQMLLHDSDTSDGHSGSAVFTGPWSKPKVIAIHKGPSGDFNWGVRLTQDRIDYIMYMRSVQK